jgi:hypothetical protein
MKAVSEHQSRRAAVHEAGHVAAAVAFGIPIIAVTIADDRPHLHRARYRPQCFSVGLRRLVTLCLSGAEAERYFCGPIPDGADTTDRRMAREYLSRRFATYEIETQIAHCQDTAARMARSPWGQWHITRIADALLQHGSLSGDEVGNIVGQGAARLQPIPEPGR